MNCNGILAVVTAAMAVGAVSGQSPNQREFGPDTVRSAVTKTEISGGPVNKLADRADVRGFADAYESRTFTTTTPARSLTGIADRTFSPRAINPGSTRSFADMQERRTIPTDSAGAPVNQLVPRPEVNNLLESAGSRSVVPATVNVPARSIEGSR